MNKSLFYLLFLFVSLPSMANAEQAPTVPIGTDNFEKLVTGGGIYVDKTLLIRDLLATDKEVVLITRPRRWGKSLNMNMLKYFFEERMDDRGKRLDQQPYRYLFKRLKIAGETRILEDFQTEQKTTVNILDHYQGRYPTILITFKDIEESTFSQMQVALETRIVHLFSEYKYLSPISHWWEESGKRDDIFLKRIRQEVIDDQNIGLKESLRTLSKWLHRHHGRKTLILIDEYDTPLNAAYKHGYPKEAIDLLKLPLARALKGNEHLEKGVITGILRVAKVDLFSGMNSFVEDSVLSSTYSAHYGFTEPEISELFQKAGLADHVVSVKNWYNGYSIGGETIYNPWSIAHYVDKKTLDTYWLRSGTTTLIEHAMADENIQGDLAILRAGKVVKKTFRKDIPFFEFQDDSSTLWPLLLYAGYLTATDCKLSDTKNEFICDLKIPNQEIARAYGDFLSDLLTRKKLPKVEQSTDINAVFEAIVQMDADQVKKLLVKQEFIPFSEEWNFNLLQLAILSANRNVFEAVYDHYHDSASLGMTSKEGLSVSDFASLAGVSYPELQGMDRNIRLPTYLEKFCWFDPQIVGATFGMLKWSYDQLPKPSVRRNQMNPWRHLYSKVGLLLDPGLGAAMGAVVQHIVQPWCKNYQAFHEINISQPRLMNRWSQLAKFVNQNPRHYLQIGSSCRPGDERVLNFKQSPFPAYLPLVRPVEFSLCTTPTTLVGTK